MTSKAYAEKFWDLLAYQQARELSKCIFDLSSSFPKSEQYSLTDQIRRASRSVGAQIAEGWGKRRYEKAFINKLIDADGEQHEVQHWLLIAADCHYITASEAKSTILKCQEIGRLIHGMISKSSSFCKPIKK